MALPHYTVALRSADFTFASPNSFTCSVPAIPAGTYRVALRAYIDTNLVVPHEIQISGWTPLNHVQNFNEGWYSIGSFSGGHNALCEFYIQDPGTEIAFRFTDETTQVPTALASLNASETIYMNLTRVI